MEFRAEAFNPKVFEEKVFLCNGFRRIVDGVFNFVESVSWQRSGTEFWAKAFFARGLRRIVDGRLIFLKAFRSKT